MAALRDALAFRRARRTLFSDAAENERRSEIQEGLAQYTGTVVAAASSDQAIESTLDQLSAAEKQESFVDAAAYTSGLAYGILLDAVSPEWRHGLQATSDLGQVLMVAARIQPAADASSAAVRYRGVELRTAETDRDRKLNARIAELRKRFVDGPVLILPGTGGGTFDIRGAIAIPGSGTVYFSTYRFAGDWGTMEATNGVLLSPDRATRTLSGPFRTEGRTLIGDGWRATVASGWSVRSGPRPSDSKSFVTIAEKALSVRVKKQRRPPNFGENAQCELDGVGMKISRPILLIGAAIAVFVTCAVGVAQQTEEPQQIADPDFKPAVERPSYTTVGPLVVLDEAHGNFHTASGRYKPFADLLQADGYRVAAGAQLFTAASLQETQVLVIANALGSGITPANINDPPSAFADAECDAVRDWVRGGGSLLLIADHAPFGATAASLASRFGVEMGKGYAWTVSNNSPEPSTTIAYSRQNGRLGEHAITRGITRVVAFTGQSLSVPSGATVLLRFADGAYESTGANAESDMEAFRNGKPNPARNLTGRAQGVAFEYGKGRLVIMGEAAMFSAQVARFTDPSGRRNEIKMGMNVPGNDNRQFLLNIMHWLTRLGE